MCKEIPSLRGEVPLRSAPNTDQHFPVKSTNHSSPPFVISSGRTGKCFRRNCVPGEGTSHALLPAALLVPWFVRRFLLFEPSRSVAKQSIPHSSSGRPWRCSEPLYREQADQALYLIRLAESGARTVVLGPPCCTDIWPAVWLYFLRKLL